MDSIRPDDFKVVNEIILSKIPTRLFIVAKII